MLTCRVILVINCFQLLQRRPLLLPPGAAITMASEKECTSHAAECVRLAGLTDDLTVRDQVLNLARPDFHCAAMAPPQRSCARGAIAQEPRRPRRQLIVSKRSPSPSAPLQSGVLAARRVVRESNRSFCDGHHSGRSHCNGTLTTIRPRRKGGLVVPGPQLRGRNGQGAAPQGFAIPAQTASSWLKRAAVKQVVGRASVAADSPVQGFRFFPHLIRGPAQKSRNCR
jgi:hypothetical protein